MLSRLLSIPCRLYIPCPRHLLERLLREARQKVRAPTSARERGIESDGYLQVPIRLYTCAHVLAIHKHMCLPYVDEQLLCKVKSKVKKSGLNVKVAWQNKGKLKNMLVRSSWTSLDISANRNVQGGKDAILVKQVSGGIAHKRM